MCRNGGEVVKIGEIEADGNLRENMGGLEFFAVFVQVFLFGLVFAATNHAVFGRFEAFLLIKFLFVGGKGELLVAIETGSDLVGHMVFSFQ